MTTHQPCTGAHPEVASIGAATHCHGEAHATQETAPCEGNAHHHHEAAAHEADHADGAGDGTCSPGCPQAGSAEADPA
ncbi:hypothetical protein [Streptomyces sp. NBC_00239]|uniref:hypothetical protein n=1 Tax=Streptomyces sp. NBC_00239 TaxID=2903640 RepID=UPI002E2AA882|nr:hypothetical protein [Streptomyces sp. NBC_00239]